MSLQIGIVGLPNVGKSTLFNALTRSRNANVANYPFCTIDPNVGVVEVPDERLQKLTQMVVPERVIPATVEFVDIAGLVKGAASGEGLGNKFLSHIRECNAVAHVVRSFRDENVIHVHGKLAPQQDREVIEAELMLADLETLDKKVKDARSVAKTGDLKLVAYAGLLERLKAHLESGRSAYDFFLKEELSEEVAKEIKSLHLITAKPILYIANVDEKDIKTVSPEAIAHELGISDSSLVIPISAKIEEELAQMSSEDANVFLEDLGLAEAGLNALIRGAYRTLGYITYFTAGPKEVRAWTVFKGARAPQAAGVIHTDFEKGFIAAEVISYDDYVSLGGEAGAKEKGKMRVEGKEYVVKDGDVMHFRFNV